MEVLGNFGINWILLLAQTVNFLLIFYLVKRFALKPILQLLKNREKTIRDGLQQAEDAKALLEQAGEKERTLLRKAQKDAQSLLQDARKERDDLLAQSEERTRKQTEKMLLEAREQIMLEAQAAEKRLSAHVSEIAKDMLEKAVSELFTEKEQKVVVDNALKKLEKKVN